MNTQAELLTDSLVKQEILDACAQGRRTGDWNPLMKRLSVALRDDELHGPFLIHAEMEIDGQRADNFVILEMNTSDIHWLRDYLPKIGGWEAIQKPFTDFFGEVPEFPNHLPATILAANAESNAGHPSTVAWFIHEFLPGIRKENLDYLCGIELVSSWALRFETFYRPARAILFDAESVRLLKDLETSLPFGAMSTLYASAHDAGHWVGTMACLPQSAPFQPYMPAFWYGALGELATDLACVAFFTDIAPGITGFILMSRLFDYTYRLAVPGPLDAALNRQFDTLANALLFEALRQGGAITPSAAGGRWHLDLDALKATAWQMTRDLQALGTACMADLASGQTAAIEPKAQAYIARFLPRTAEGRWAYTPALNSALSQIEHLPLHLTMDKMQPRYPMQATLEAFMREQATATG